MTDKQLVDIMEGEQRIFLIRGHKVMLDVDLAALYELKIEALNHLVSRNIECFPEDFMFKLNAEEISDLKSRFSISGSTKPYVFTGQGLALLSSVLYAERSAHFNQGSCAPTCSCNK